MQSGQEKNEREFRSNCLIFYDLLVKIGTYKSVKKQRDNCARSRRGVGYVGHRSTYVHFIDMDKEHTARQLFR